MNQEQPATEIKDAELITIEESRRMQTYLVYKSIQNVGGAKTTGIWFQAAFKRQPGVIFEHPSS